MTASAPVVASVNVGTPQQVSWTRGRRTAIEKRPVTGPVAVRALGLDGDQVSNRKHHGGVDKAVYAFAREDLDRWGDELGSTLPDGFFGENLTTAGIDVNEAEIGERWRIGSAELEVAGIRTPCQTFSSWLRVSGLDNRGWAARFTAAGRPGPYLRVVREGELAAGDGIEVLHRPGHGLTVTAMFRQRMAAR
ncbi:MOSC domain-containing protein [Nocardioides caricicola]|uniref:MOSC domain-containing protein n=1 Tax=Nocardioides caricicola TaxID=634770 RepID=A0ABW0N3K2_9ACTN